MSLLMKKFGAYGGGGTRTITLANFIYYSSTGWTPTYYAPTTTDYYAVGMDRGADYYALTPDTRGSLNDYTYVDGGSTERTISAIYYVESEWVMFSLEGTSIPNTSDTFVSIVLNGTTYAFADSFYVASFDGGTHWYWADDATGPWGGATSGVKEIVINI